MNALRGLVWSVRATLYLRRTLGEEWSLAQCWAIARACWGAEEEDRRWCLKNGMTHLWDRQSPREAMDTELSYWTD